MCEQHCGLYEEKGFSVIFYTVLFIAGTCHLQTVVKTPSMFGFCIVMAILSAVCTICSVIMLIGLYKDNKLLLLPWTVSVAMTTLIDVMVSFYLIRDAISHPFIAVLFVVDVMICAVNVYALLCVLSQYQEYKTEDNGEHIIEDRHQAVAHEPVPKAHVTTSVTDDVTSSNALLLPPVSPMKNSTVSVPMAKVVCCELTTISEEKHTPTPLLQLQPRPLEKQIMTSDQRSIAEPESDQMTQMLVSEL